MRRSRRFGILVKSYVRGTDYPPLPDHTISKQLEMTAQKFPDHLAVASYAQEKYLTYHHLFDKATRLAANLIDAGLQRGDRVLVFLPQCIEFYVLQLACALSDSILISVNVDSGASELNDRLNACRASFLFTSNFDDGCGLFKKVQDLRAAQKSLPAEQQISNVINTMKRIFVMGAKDLQSNDPKVACFERQLMGVEPSLKSVNTVKSIITYQNPGSATLVSYTSGTTGRSKGVALSHRNLMNNAINFAQEIRFTPHEKILQPVPLYTTFGLCMGNLAALSVGATVVYPGFKKEARKIIAAANKFEPSFILGSAQIYLSMIDELKSSGPMVPIPRGVLGGSICTEALINSINEKLRIKNLTVCYGMTETSSVSFMTRAQDSREKKVSTVGQVLHHLEAKIVDKDGFIVDIGKIGELMVKGYSVFNCYYNNQEATRNNLINGWVKSGDLAVMDSDGYVRIIGHRKEIIIRAGENIYPADVEQVLKDDPAFKEVKVAGVSDPVVGEEVAVFLVMADPSASLDRDALGDKLSAHLRRYQLPKYAITVAELPRTSTGKIQSFKLREEFQKLGENGGLAGSEMGYKKR